jgi:DNA-binding CsgD family transcriptional regulator
MEIEKITISELLTFKHLTKQIRPFRTIYKKYEKTFRAKGLRGLTDELVVRFLLIFVRNHAAIWMRFENEPLDKLFSREEWATICDRWGNDNYAIAISTLDRWLCKRFKESLTKEEVHSLLTDFETSLNDAKELLDSARVFLDSLQESLKKGWLTKDEVLDFLNGNKEDKTPEAYRRCMAFFEKFPIEYQKFLVDALVIERNYLSRLHDLPAHFQAVESGLFTKYFLKTLEIHAQKIGKALRERMGDYLGDIYEIYYSILGKFKRQPKAHFEHYLNRYLHRERKHLITDRQKTILYDDLMCPFCGFDLTETVNGKATGSVICPSCTVAVGIWAFKNKLHRRVNLRNEFLNMPGWSRDGLGVDEETPISDKPFSHLDEVVMAIEENEDDGASDESGEEGIAFDAPTLDDLLSWASLTAKEKELIQAIREADGEGISISEVLRRIAREQGKSEHTVREHYKHVVTKLKNVAKKIK